MFCLFGGNKPTFIENSFLASIWGSIVPYPLHHVVDSVKMTFTFPGGLTLITYTTHPSVPYSLRVLYSFLKSLRVGGMVLLLALVSPAVADDAAFDQWMFDLRA